MQTVRDVELLLGIVGFPLSCLTLLLSAVFYSGTPQWRRHYQIGRWCALGMLVFGMMIVGGL